MQVLKETTELSHKLAPNQRGVDCWERVKGLMVPYKDHPNLETVPLRKKSAWYHKGFGQMSLAPKAALQLLPHIVVKRNQMETASVDIMPVGELAQVQVEPVLQVIGLEAVCQTAADDEIYTICQTCTVQSSHSRNTLFHPVVMEIRKNLMKQGQQNLLPA